MADILDVVEETNPLPNNITDEELDAIIESGMNPQTEEIITETQEPPAEEVVGEEPPVMEEEPSILVDEATETEITPDYVKALEAEVRQVREAETQRMREAELGAFLEKAREQGYSDEQAIQAFQEEEEKIALEKEVLELKAEKRDLETLTYLKNAEKELVALDPELKQITSMPQELLDYLGTVNADGVFEKRLPAKQAYYAWKAEQKMTEKVPPAVAGKIKSEIDEGEFFSESEIDQMDPDEILKHMDKVERSISKINTKR